MPHPFLLQSKGSDQRNSGPEKKSDTETRTTSSNSKKEDYKKNRHKSPEKFKNIDKRSDRSSHHKKSSTDSARSEKPHRDHHRHRWFIFAFYRKKIDFMLRFVFVVSPHCYFIRLNPRKKGTFKFCLPALLGIHRNSKQKEFFRSSKGFLR